MNRSRLGKFSKAITVVMTLVMMSGCFASKGGAYRVFADDLERQEGRQFESATGSFYLRKFSAHTPIEILKLKDGNEIRVYQATGYRGRKLVTVYVEVDPMQRVVQISCRGDCWRPY